MFKTLSLHLGSTCLTLTCGQHDNSLKVKPKHLKCHLVATVQVVNTTSSMSMNERWAKIKRRSQDFSKRVSVTLGSLFEYSVFWCKNKVKQHDGQLRLTRDCSRLCIDRTSGPLLHPPITTPQSLAPSVQDGGFHIWDILA